MLNKSAGAAGNRTRDSFPIAFPCVQPCPQGPQNASVGLPMGSCPQVICAMRPKRLFSASGAISWRYVYLACFQCARQRLRLSPKRQKLRLTLFRPVTYRKGPSDPLRKPGTSPGNTTAASRPFQAAATSIHVRILAVLQPAM